MYGAEKHGNLLSNGMDSQRELLFKILVIGDYGVGKTAVVRRYTEGLFTSNYKITIGADFSVKSMKWDDKTQVNLQLWDIAGHERFGCMTRVYYKYAVGAALVFDVSRVSTFQNLTKWLEDLREKVELQDGLPVPVVVLANKCDMSDMVISKEAIDKFCKTNNISGWFFTSAKENVNIDETMMSLVSKIVEVKSRNPSHPDGIVLSNTAKEHRSCCGS